MVRFIAPLVGAAALFSQVSIAGPVANPSEIIVAGSIGVSSGNTFSGVSGSSGGINNIGSSSSSNSQLPQFGSGSSGGFGSSSNTQAFSNCVQQCVAQFGSGSASNIPPSSTGTISSGSGSGNNNIGSGATKTVIVSPTAGVLRYVPFAINASVGDTVRFIWGAGPHTVTKSSELTVCNATLDTSKFTSGRQNASFMFDQQVTSTDPTFFFCTVPSHCQKGMFGVINPPSALGSDLSIGGSIDSLISANPALQAAVQSTNSITAGTSAANWGNGILVKGQPINVQTQMIENMLYTRQFYAANPGLLEMGQGAATPPSGVLNMPADIPDTLAAVPPPSNQAATSAGSSAPLTFSSGARSLGASGVAVAVAAAAAAMFAL